jgi:phosphoribosylanthranilate isomerase
MSGGEQGNRIWIKICGITNAADAQYAIDCGADAVGFNFYPGSKRYIDLEAGRDWMDELPGTICKVAILVNPSVEEAVRVSQLPFIDVLQLHGDESSDFCQSLAERGIRFAKALPVANANSLLDLPPFFTDMLVLDTATESGFGGGGRIFPWQLARKFVEMHPTFRIVMAGGLTPENVAQAIVQVRPSGVDVTSGVESGPGRKDRDRLRAFIQAARGK